MLRKWIVATLLKALNSQWLNHSPGRYGFIGNVDAFSYSHLASEEQQRPGITVRASLDEADRFRACSIRSVSGFEVMEGDVTREGDMWDLHELRKALTPKVKAKP